MIAPSSKTRRSATYTLYKKLLLTFWAVAVIPLLLQTFVSTTVARNHTFELVNLVLSAETSSSVNPQTLAELTRRQSFSMWFFSFVIIVITVGVFTLLAKRLSRPYANLLAQTEQIAEGAFGVEVSQGGNYEVDRLALAFNRLTQELRDRIDRAEELIAERTRALETVVRSLKSTTDITKQITMLLDLDDLLQYIVDNLQKTFGYYYVHIYLVDEERQSLLMVHGSGEVGQQLKARGHQMKLGEGIVGSVAETNQYFLSNDVNKTPNFVRNSMLPDTRAELAVPLRKGDQVLGVLDIQTRQTDRFEPQDVALIQSIANQTAVAVDNARLFKQISEANAEIKILNDRLKEENLRMSAELDVTRRLQEMVLPAPEELQAIEGLDIAGYMKPADEVGGDYYDVLKHNGYVTMGIGDVTGHGLESGVLMLMTQTAIRTLVEHGETDLRRILTTLNKTLYRNIQRTAINRILTFSMVNFEQQQLKLVGYHEEMIVVRANGAVELVDTVGLGTFVGLEPEIGTFLAEESVTLQPGDGVVLYTDGITEAENEAKEMYGLPRLCDAVSRRWANHNAADIAQGVVGELESYIGNQTVYDDITLLVMKSNP